MILIHPSSLGKIMADAQSIDPQLMDDATREIYYKKKKTDEDKAMLAPLWDRTLSAGAKTYLCGLAKEIVYGYRSHISTKFMEKGLQCEQAAIDLYNEVFFTAHVKNTERRENEWLSGECDIQDEDTIKDIKNSWSLETFPATSAMAHDTDYEWQLRGYMMLWEKPFAELAYCLVSTPEELIRNENPTVHMVDHIPPAMRVTRVRYTRDLAVEERIKIKCSEAQKYVARLVEQIQLEHA